MAARTAGLLVGLIALTGCSALLQTDFEVVDASPDGGMDAGRIDAGPFDAGGLDAGMLDAGRCFDDVCDPDGCGCAMGQHCYPLSGAGRVCTVAGTRALGARCTTHGECEPGLACSADGECRVFCNETADCAAAVGPESTCTLPMVDTDARGCSDSCTPGQPCGAGPDTFCTIEGPPYHPVCVVEDGGGGLAQACPPATCRNVYTCAFSWCSEWCRLDPKASPSDCPSSRTCTRIGPGVFIDGVEYGACRR